MTDRSILDFRTSNRVGKTIEKLAFTLRAPIQEDIPLYTAMLGRAEVSVWLEDRCQRHVSEHEVRLFLLDQTWCVFSIVVGDRFVGVAGLTDPSVREDVARFFIVIGDTEMWGRGLGSDVTQEVVRFGFETLGLRKIVSDYLDGNEGSKRIHERAGFQVEGIRRQDAWRNGGWVNRVVLSILQSEINSVR